MTSVFMKKLKKKSKFGVNNKDSFIDETCSKYIGKTNYKTQEEFQIPKIFEI